MTSAENRPADSSVSSPDGRFRIEGFSYLPNDGRFGEAPAELQRLVDAATGNTIVDEAEAGYHATMTFEPDGRVRLRVGGFKERSYVLDPARRLFARAEAPESWRPLSELRETERAIMLAEHADWYAGTSAWKTSVGMRRMVYLSALGALVFGGLTAFPPPFPWWDVRLRVTTACPFVLGLVYFWVAAREYYGRK